MRFTVLLASVMTAALAFPMPAFGQRIQFPTTNGLRPVGSTVQNTTPAGGPASGVGPVMVPLNSNPGVFPPGMSGPSFDAYSTRQVTTPNFPQTNPYPPSGSIAPSLGGPTTLPQTAPTMPSPGFGTNPTFGAAPGYGATPTFNTAPGYGYPGYNGAAPSLPV